MFYDELKALKERLEAAFYLLSCDPLRSETQIERGQFRILKRLSLVNRKILEVEKNMRDYTRRWKREVKYEFLRQAYDGYLYEDIIAFLENYYDNSEVNIKNFIENLKYDEQTGKGYYRVDEHGEVSLTSRAERYLENVANVSLKR